MRNKVGRAVKGSLTNQMKEDAVKNLVSSELQPGEDYIVVAFDFSFYVG